MTARADGFTLVELLVALAVLGLVGAALVQAERLAVGGVGRTEGRVVALAAAASLLAEREAGARGDGDGRLGDGSRFRIDSRVRRDLVRPGAALLPIEMTVAVRPRTGSPVRLAGLGWTHGTRR